METITNMLLVNATTILVVIVSLILLRNKNIKSKKLFISGLLVIVISGLLAIPVVDHFLGSVSNLVLSNIVGAIHAIGLLCCVFAFRRSASDA